jgi:hypothetical protein
MRIGLDLIAGTLALLGALLWLLAIIGGVLTTKFRGGLEGEMSSRPPGEVESHRGLAV